MSFSLFNFLSSIDELLAIFCEYYVWLSNVHWWASIYYFFSITLMSFTLFYFPLSIDELTAIIFVNTSNVFLSFHFLNWLSVVHWCTSSHYILLVPAMSFYLFHFLNFSGYLPSIDEHLLTLFFEYHTSFLFFLSLSNFELFLCDFLSCFLSSLDGHLFILFCEYYMSFFLFFILLFLIYFLWLSVLLSNFFLLSVVHRWVDGLLFILFCEYYTFFFFFLSSSPSELFLSDFSVWISVAHWCTSIHFILWILYVFLNIFVLLFINVFHCFLVFLAFCRPSMRVYIFLWILLMLGYVPCKK